MSNPCSTPPSEPVVWRCIVTTSPDLSRVAAQCFVAAKSWFEARAFAGAHFSVSPHEIRCDLFTLEQAREDLLDLLDVRALIVSCEPVAA